MLLPDQMKLINLLAEHIASGFLTQDELARASGVHQSQISRILSGNLRRASKNVLKLCKYANTLSPGSLESNDLSDEIIAVVTELFGKSRAENQALAQLMLSMNKWRKTWEGRR